MIEYRCTCGKRFSLADELAGKKEECCFCNSVGTVKGSPPQAAPASPPAPVRVTPSAAGGPLSSFKELFGRAWGLYKRKFLTMLGLMLLSIVLVLLSFLGMLPFALLAKMMASIKTPLVLAGFLVTAGGVMYVMSWTSAAYFHAIAFSESGVMESLRRTRGLAWGYMGFLALWSLLVMGGSLLLLIPGILFAVWFILSPFVYLEEDGGSFASLMRSREYVRGYWWPLALRLLGVWLIYALISAIPFVGQLAGFLLGPFLFIHIFVVYEDLKRIKGPTLPEPTRGAKAGVLVTGLAGFIAIPLAAILISGAALTGILFKTMTMFKGGTFNPAAVMQMQNRGSGN